MKTLIRYNYSNCYLYRVWSPAGTEWNWKMYKEQLGRALFVKGSIRVLDALDKSIVGDVLTGFYDYRNYPQYNTLDAWQKVVTDIPTEWVCVHHDVLSLDCSMVPVSSQTMVPDGTGVIVIEGSITANDAGKALVASEYQHIKARPYTYTIDGDAKVFFIR